ncbi:MAG: cytochrome c, partial [Planctomycetota bacterium]
LLVLGMSCASTSARDDLPPGDTLSPMMKTLRVRSRDFKRALILENKHLFLPTARDLVSAVRELNSIEAPATFTLHIEALVETTEALCKAAQDRAPQDRIEVLFGNVIGTCSGCHDAFRK